jgi:hypothetical protein
MPFKSKAQERYLFAKKPALARRWAKLTKNDKHLPERKGNDADSKSERKHHVKDGDE